MHKAMTDQELKETMKTIAKVAGLNLTDERIDRALPAFKNFLSDFDAIKNVELAVEDESSMIFRLKKQPAKKGGV
ncbi:MAG: hypothetical protein ACREQA_23780 [Candidatus Binatia bacterium]